MAADIDELLERAGDLLGIADHGDAGAGRAPGSGRSIGCGLDLRALGLGQLLHAAVGFGGR